jgi:UrcA family protein
MPRNLNMKAAIGSGLCAALSAVLLVSMSVPAGAGESIDVQRRVVKFADLDLTHGAGVAELYARIHSAARDVCVPVISGDLLSVVNARACAARAIERAIAAVNSPRLTSYYLAKTRRVITVAHRD